MTGPAVAPGRALAALAAYLAGIVLVAGAASPWVLAALHAAGAGGATLDEVAVRTLQLVAIAATFPLVAALGGVGRGGWRGVWGVPPRRGLATRLVRGFAAGVASLGIVCAALFALEVRVPLPDQVWPTESWIEVAAAAAAPALAVALLEELWFRGGLFTALERCGGAAVALWVGAAVYAAAHFLESPPPPGPHGALSGFAMLGRVAAAVLDPANVDSFVALLAAGVALGVARIRDGDVALAIGIHAGWVFTIKVFKKFTYVSEASGLRALAGRYDDLIGWLAAAVLAGLALVLWWRLPARGAGAR